MLKTWVRSVFRPFKLGVVLAVATLSAACGGGGESTSGCDGFFTPPCLPARPPVINYIYVANNIDSSGTVSGFRMDETSGALTQVSGSPFPAAGNPSAVEGLGDLLFVANSTSSSISTYSIQQGTGLLVPLTGSPFSTGAGTLPRALRFRFPILYVVSASTDSVLAFALSNAGLVALGASVPTGSAPAAVVLHPNGKFAYVTNAGSNDISLYSVDQATGVLASMGARVAAGSGPGASAFVHRGKFFYVTNFNSNDVSAYAADATTGALTSLGTVAAGLGPISLVPYPNLQEGEAKFLYVANLNSNDISTYSIDPASGALTSIGPPTAAGVSPRSLTIPVFSSFLYAANMGSGNVSGYAINATTGALASLGAPVPAGANPFSITQVRR